MPLPYCTDEQLIDELAVVVSTGFALPSRPARAPEVRHLLLLADPEGRRPFAPAALRLLQLLDDALLESDLASETATLSADDALGLRILFGVQPAYRSVLSPTERRAAASELLVPDWSARPPTDRASTFQRRHQRTALWQMLHALRAVYGQDARPSLRDTDTLSQERTYWVGANRQVVRYRCIDRLRVRLDGLETHWFTEPMHTERGVTGSDFRLIPDKTDSGVTLESIQDMPTRPGNRQIQLRLPRSYRVGEELRVGWEEEVHFGADVDRWRRFFVATQAPNDGFELRLSVVFESGCDLPDMLWHYAGAPDVDPFETGPRAGESLAVDGRLSASNRWSASATERRIDYGLQWVWPPD